MADVNVTISMPFSEGHDDLGAREVRRVYLITYSKANLEIVPTRNSFAQIILEAFENTSAGSNCSVEEPHTSGGVHFHMAVKLSSRRRWLRAREYIERRYGIKVNFSSRHENYYTVWKYTTKEDCEALQSDNHPDLENAGEPRTGHASNAHQINRQAEGKTAGGKRKRKPGGYSLIWAI